MSADITKSQKQDLGEAIEGAGQRADEFIYNEKRRGDYDVAILTSRKTTEEFTFHRTSDRYKVEHEVPGTFRKVAVNYVTWSEVIELLSAWVFEVQKEAEAIDPWEQDAENMASDDSYFTVDELPKVDYAIDESVAELKSAALSRGEDIVGLQGQLDEVAKLLKKTARDSTKKEWMAIFKGIMIEKIVDWGMGMEIFQIILHKLITSVQDVAQLAEHASKHLL